MKSLLLKLSIATGVLCAATIIGHPIADKSANVPESYTRLAFGDGNPLPVCPPVCPSPEPLSQPRPKTIAH